jgi:hypothetical protein
VRGSRPGQRGCGGWAIAVSAVVVPVGKRVPFRLASWNGVDLTVPDRDALLHRLGSLPAGLSRLDTAFLATVVESVLPPATAVPCSPAL